MNEPLTVQEVSASYQVMLDSLPVRVGYKQTEVGVIPEDWEVKPLVEVATIATGNTPPTSVAANYGDEYFFVSPADLGEHKFILDAGKKLSQKGFGISRKFPANSILFTCIGSTIGKCGIAQIELTSNQQINAIFPDKSFSSEYLYYELSFLSPRIKALAGEQAVPLINKTQFGESPVALPPLPEQRAIATALSDVDALLAAQDKLIAKKRDIKQAAMHQLLTAKQRLPGFSGEWEVVKAGDVGRFRGGNGFPTRYQGAGVGEYPFFKVSDMNNVGNEIFMETANNYVSEELRKQLGVTAFPAGSIVIAKVGAAIFLERKKILPRASCLDNNMAAFVMDSSRANYSFIHYVLLNIKLGSLVSTTALPSLSGSVLSEIELRLPSLPEQIAIATILSDMDADLAALEQQRDKTRALKQAMMQELLTGRIRLV
jgi:type I restriction enzyme S subunit